MRRKWAVTFEEMEHLEAFHLELRTVPGGDAGLKIALYAKIKLLVGKEAARIALMLYEANIPFSHVINYFTGDTQLNQNNNPNGQNVSQSSGRDMIGVNAIGNQTFKESSIYSTNLESGVPLSVALKDCLIETRSLIETADLEEAVKAMVIDNFDKLTDEIKKGDKKNPSLVKGMWDMLKGVVGGIPKATAAVISLDKLRTHLGI